MTATLRLHLLFTHCIHHTFRKGINFATRYITVTFKNVLNICCGGTSAERNCPEKFLIPIQKAKRNVKREVQNLKRPETSPKCLINPVQLPKVFHRHFFTVSHSQFQALSQTEFQTCFTTRIWRHGHADNLKCHKFWSPGSLDGRNRAIAIAASLARVIAAIRIASVRWRSYLPRKHRISPHRPCVRCAAIRIARLAITHLAFAPCGTAVWLARVDRAH